MPARPARALTIDDIQEERVIAVEDAIGRVATRRAATVIRRLRSRWPALGNDIVFKIVKEEVGLEVLLRLSIGRPSLTDQRLVILYCLEEEVNAAFFIHDKATQSIRVEG